MKIISVPFHGQSVSAVKINKVPYVALKPICENIGVDWKSQQERLKANPVLNSVRVLRKATGPDNKQYRMLMLPLEYLNGWLFGINANRVHPNARTKLIQYQTDCYKALYKHFSPEPVKSLPKKKKPVSIDTIEVVEIDKDLMPLMVASFENLSQGYRQLFHTFNQLGACITELQKSHHRFELVEGYLKRRAQ